MKVNMWIRLMPRKLRMMLMKFIQRMGYHSLHSSDYNDSSDSDVDGVGNMDGLVYTIDLDNPIIDLGRKFKDVQKLQFSLR